MYKLYWKLSIFAFKREVLIKRDPAQLPRSREENTGNNKNFENEIIILQT